MTKMVFFKKDINVIVSVGEYGAQLRIQAGMFDKKTAVITYKYITDLYEDVRNRYRLLSLFSSLGERAKYLNKWHKQIVRHLEQEYQYFHNGSLTNIMQCAA